MARRPDGPVGARWANGVEQTPRLVQSLRQFADPLGVLATERPATKGVRDALGRSRWPLAYMCCSREGGVVSQMLWNRAAEELGLEGYAVVPRRGGGGEESALVLMHNGAVVGDVSEEK